MRIAVVGGGPGGLFFATLLRAADASHQVTVFERNRAEDAFGFGVVFSDRTLATIDAADPVMREALAGHGRHWDDIEVRLKGERIRCGGMGMAAITRSTLLGLLQRRAGDAGVELRFSTEVDYADLTGYDLVVGADGSSSRLREAVDDELGGSVETATAKFIWFGTDYLFDGLTFVHERGPHGVFAVHGYPISDSVSTFIVEADEPAWRAAGLDSFDVTQPPGPSDLASKSYLEALFAEQIDGHRLLVNNSRWGSFRTRRTRRWYSVGGAVPVVFLGDAVHTAHFSVGSGTKMAMEDAIALVEALREHPGDVAAALPAYEAAARPSVDAIQASARPSLSWWEHFGRYHDAFPPWQFAYHFLTRSLSDARLARRDPGFVAATRRAWAEQHGTPPLATPLEAGGWRVPGRVATVGRGEVRPGSVIEVAGGDALPVCEAAPGAGPWAALVRAPADEHDMPAALDRLTAVMTGEPAVVAVHGGTALTRTLVCEAARLGHAVASVLVDDGLDADTALTAVLSGRTDLVAADPATVTTWTTS